TGATRVHHQCRLGAADLAVLDASNPSDYTGTQVLAPKAGHVPGQINFEWTAGLGPGHAPRMRADITEVLDAFGITPGKEVLT
ncbi:sulfurtransferase, partial [Pseudomonas aeruginosa]